MITYPLNNIDYTAEDAELYFSTRHSGVYDGDDDFAVTVSGIDNDVTVGAGIAWIRNTKFSGKVAALKNPKTLTLDLADSVYDRIDAIVIRFDASENSSDVIVKRGTASSLPVAPSVSRTESVYELHIFHIYRRAGATTIGVNDVIDQRKNKDYCGVMFDPISSIDETLSKKGFAADAASVGNALENAGGTKIELLWENASPTSQFPAQTLSATTLGSESFTWFIVQFYDGTEVMLKKGAPYAPVTSVDAVAQASTYFAATTRAADIDASGNVRFGVGMYKPANNNSYYESGNTLVPYRIFGIKGVIE